MVLNDDPLEIENLWAMEFSKALYLESILQNLKQLNPFFTKIRPTIPVTEVPLVRPKVRQKRV